MSDDEQENDAVNVAENSTPPKRVIGRPFVKGDPRAWRKGRPRVPKTEKELRKLLIEIAAEEMENPNTGEKIDRLRLMLRGMFTSRQHADKEHILDRLYGKVPQSLALTGENGGPIETKSVIEIVEYVNGKKA